MGAKFNGERRAARVENRAKRARVPDGQGELVPNERTVWAAHDACFTPRLVARQIVTELRTRFGLIGGRILDLGAGAGSFTAEIRALLAPSLLVAVEPRDAERPHLQRWADQTHTMDAAGFLDFAAGHGAIGAFDAVIGNPPWWCWTEVWRAAWELVDRRQGLVAFLGPSNWGHSHEDAEGLDVFAEAAPMLQLRVARRISFNGGSATDNRKCSAWVWRRGSSGRMENGWLCCPLPDLGENAYRWRIRPGLEDLCV